MLKELTRIFKAEVEVLHVKKIKEPVEAGFEHQPERASGLEDVLEDVEHIYRDSSDEHILSGIQRGGKEYRPDLLVMVPHHTGFWNSVFNRSKTRKMALKTQIPLLSIPFHPEQEA